MADVQDGRGLRIERVRAVLLSHRYAPGEELTWVSGVIRSWDAALVEVTLSDGTTGIGEAGAGIMAAAAVPGIVDAYRPYVEGVTFADPLDVGDYLRAHTAFWSRGGIVSGVAGAIEAAAIDAVGVREELPAYEILGGLRRPSIEAYASGGLGTTFDEVSDWAAAQVAAGFSTVKFRAMTDPETTIRLLDHVVGRLPAGTRFILDAVQASASAPWETADAIRVGRHAAELGARWFEEPCGADDIEGYATVRREVGVPVSGVESNGTERDFAQLLDARALDIAQPDVTFVGGPRVFRRVSERAAAAGVACVPHVWGSAVTFAANLHTVLADPHVELFEFCTLPNPLRDAMRVEPVEFRDGRIFAPTAPGFGLMLTAEMERDFAFTPGGGHVIR